MSHILKNKQLDGNYNKTIDTKELNSALDTGFFENQKNITLLQKELFNIEGLLEQSFCDTLRKAYSEAKTGAPTVQNQKIITLFETLLGKHPKHLQFTQAEDLPTPHLHLMEGFENTAYNKVFRWYETSYPSEFQETKQGAQTKHSRKPKEYQRSYIQYEIAKTAVSKYMTLLEKEEEDMLKKNGYTSSEEFGTIADAVIDIIDTLEKEIQKKFPSLKKDQKEWRNYNNKINSVAKSTGYDKPGIFEEHMKYYEAYDIKLSKAIDPEQFQNSIQVLENSTIASGEDMQQYLESYNYVQQASETIDTLQQEAGSKMLSGFLLFNQSVQKITQDFGEEKIKKLGHTMQKYAQFTDTFMNNCNVDVSKFMKTQKALHNSGRSKKYHDSLQLYNRIHDPENPDKSFFKGVVRHSQDKKQKQSKTDGRYNWLKILSMKNPETFQTVNFLTGTWNGLIDAIIGTGSSLGIMLMSTWKDDSQLVASTNFKDKFDTFLKFNTSSSMKAPPIDKDGKWNLKLDNTVNQVGQQVSNMLVLLYGGTGITQSAARLGVNVGAKTALFSSAIIQQSGRNFVEAKGQGLSDQEAFGYTMLLSIGSSGLELVSPNHLLTGQWKNVLQNLAGESGQKSIIATFAKHMGKEILKENIQETGQLAFKKGINMWANGQWHVEFNETFSWEEFGTTAVLTSLTTGLVTTPGATNQARMDGGMNDMQKQNLIKSIKNDPPLREKYLKQIDKIVLGEVTASGINISKVKELKILFMEANVNDSKGVGNQNGFPTIESDDITEDNNEVGKNEILNTLKQETLPNGKIVSKEIQKELRNNSKSLYQGILKLKKELKKSSNKDVVIMSNWKNYILKNEQKINQVINFYEKKILKIPGKQTSQEIIDFHNIKREYLKFLNYRHFINKNILNLKIGEVIYVNGKRYIIVLIEDGVLSLSGKDKQITLNTKNQKEINNIDLIKQKIDLADISQQINESEYDLINKLRPNTQEATLQGNYHDCYILAVLHHIKQLPQFKQIMNNLIVPVSTGRDVKFKSSKIKIRGEKEGYLTEESTGSQEFRFPDQKIHITHADLFEWKKANQHVSSLNDGDILLEVAYAKLIQSRYNVAYGGDPNPSIQEINSTFYNRRNFPVRAFEDGWGWIAFKSIVGEGVFLNSIPTKKFESIIDELKENGDKYLYYAGSISKPNTESVFDNEKFELTDVNGNKQYIYYSHAYIIGKFTKATITIINPHFTGISLTFDKETFQKGFLKIEKSDFSSYSSTNDDLN